MIKSPVSNAALALALATSCAAIGCSTMTVDPDRYVKSRASIEAEHFLAGEALAQRKQKMHRAHRDLLNFHANLESLRRHEDHTEIALLDSFLRPYMSDHVDNLLSDREQGWNPELTRIDADLLFTEAALLVELRDKEALGELIERIAARYDGLDSMLVAYPIGSESAVFESLAELRRQHFELRSQASLTRNTRRQRATR